TEIVYTVKEDALPNYDSDTTGDAAGGFTITNTNTEKVSVPVEKKWVGPEATSVTVHLLADEIDTGKSVTLNASGNWKGSFTDLPKYKADGTEIVYTVKEDALPNYDSQTTGDATAGFTITNTNTEKVTVPVTKAWDDADNQDGKRPTSVTAHLYADGVDTGKTVTLNEANSWKDSFSDLPKYKADGSEIVYTVKEDAVTDYTSQVATDASGNVTITNTHTPATTGVAVTKAWVGDAATSVTVHLLADGVDTGKSVTLNAAGNWKGSFTDLPKYKSGALISYTVKEDDISGYTSAISGDATSGFTITNTQVPVTPDNPTTPDTPSTPKPKTPASILPKTGDDGILPLAGTMLAAALASVGAAFARRRAEGQEH
uniref:Cna B-type domain-containing protein n=1 Tax=Cryptobacterium curtum TaxID=84163 RepID=UPI0028D364C9